MVKKNSSTRRRKQVTIGWWQPSRCGTITRSAGTTPRHILISTHPSIVAAVVDLFPDDGQPSSRSSRGRTPTCLMDSKG